MPSPNTTRVSFIAHGDGQGPNRRTQTDSKCLEDMLLHAMPCRVHAVLCSRLFSIS